jgi:dihydrofolate reductase
MELIFAMDKNGGIGYRNRLPWKCKKELEIFKSKTLFHILIVGRKTFESMPILKDRVVCCLSRSLPENEEKLIFNSIFSVLDFAKKYHKNKKIFIGGGSEIFDLVLKEDFKINRIHQSVMNGDFKIDTFLNMSKMYQIKEQFDIKTICHEDFKEYIWTNKTHFKDKNDDYIMYTRNNGKDWSTDIITIEDGLLASCVVKRNCKLPEKIELFRPLFPDGNPLF